MSAPVQPIVRINASPEEAWAYLSDLRRRPEWDYSLRGVEMKGELSVGLEGSFQKMKGPDRRFSVHALVPGKRLRLWEQSTVGALEWEHRIEPAGEGVELHLECTASGAGRFLPAPDPGQVKLHAERLKARIEDPTDEPARYPFLLEGFPMVHRAMRKDVVRLDGLLRRIQLGEGVDTDTVRAWFAFVWAIAEGHHLGEDNQIFPRVAARCPGFRSAWHQIESEHQQLDAAIRALDLTLKEGVETGDVEPAIDAVRVLRDQLEGHLVREEVAFERAIRADWSPEEQLALQDVLRKAIPLRLIELVIPWMLDAASEAERKHFLAQLPLPARVLYNVSWKAHYHSLLVPFAVLPG